MLQLEVPLFLVLRQRLPSIKVVCHLSSRHGLSSSKVSAPGSRSLGTSQYPVEQEYLPPPYHFYLQPPNMGKLIPNAFNLGVVIFVALGSTACSYGMAIIGSTLGQPSFYKSLNLAPQGEPGYSKTAEYIGAFNGVNAAGSAIGALVCAYAADKYSRKRTIQYAAGVLIVGAAICAGAVNNGMFGKLAPSLDNDVSDILAMRFLLRRRCADCRQ